MFVQRWDRGYSDALNAGSWSSGFPNVFHSARTAGWQKPGWDQRVALYKLSGCQWMAGTGRRLIERHGCVVVAAATTPAATAGYGDGTKSDRIIDKCCPSTASRDDSDTSAGGLSIPGVVDYLIMSSTCRRTTVIVCLYHARTSCLRGDASRCLRHAVQIVTSTQNWS